MTSEILDHRPSALAEHEEKALGNAAFGFWIYLMTDCILFAALFSTFVVYSYNYAAGPKGAPSLDLPYTFAETMFLLASSAACGLAIVGAYKDSAMQVLGWLALTFLLGLGFVGMEVHEFLGLVQAGTGPDSSGFLSAFFTLVGTHGTHVAVGLVWMAIMMGQVLGKGLTVAVQSRLMRMSLFWHFLDIVWIGVFTVVYLKGAL